MMTTMLGFVCAWRANAGTSIHKPIKQKIRLVFVTLPPDLVCDWLSVWIAVQSCGSTVTPLSKSGLISQLGRIKRPVPSVPEGEPSWIDA
jgi:hypothetical protein